MKDCIILDRKFAKLILEFLEDTQDEGPLASGWQSKELVDTIAKLEALIDEENEAM